MAGVLFALVVGFFAFYDYGLMPAFLIGLLVLFGVAMANGTKE